MLSHSAAQVKTTVLTNAMILNDSRLDRLCEINHDNLIVQVSLDGGNAEDHDYYRGAVRGTRRSKGSSAYRSAASGSA